MLMHVALISKSDEKRMFWALYPFGYVMLNKLRNIDSFKKYASVDKLSTHWMPDYCEDTLNMKLLLFYRL